MPNFFEQFDTPSVEPKKEKNFFEQFHETPTTQELAGATGTVGGEGFNPLTATQSDWAKFIKEAPPLSLSGIFLKPFVSGEQAMREAWTTGRFNPNQVTEGAMMGLAQTAARGSGKLISQVTEPTLGLAGRAMRGFSAESAKPIGPSPGPLRPNFVKDAMGNVYPYSMTPEQVSTAGLEAAKIPTGRLSLPEEAGGVIRPKVEASPVPVPGLYGAQTNEDMFNRLLTMAGSTNKEDIKVIHRMRASVPPEEWGKVQSATISRLGQKGDVAFDPEAFVTNYGQLSSAGKNAMFPSKDLTSHLDVIAEVSKRASEAAAQQAEMASHRGVVSRIGSNLGYMARRPFFAVAHPLYALGGLFGSMAIQKAMTRPATAAPIAQWMRSYEALVRRPGSGTLAGFNMASRNLNNTLGGEVSIEDFLKAINVQVERGPVNYNPLEGPIGTGGQ